MREKQCPKCGYEAKSYEAICPFCLYEFSQVEQSKAVKEFTQELNKLEKKKKRKIDFAAFKKIGEKIPHTVDPTDEQINSLIRLYDFPGTIVDTYGFMLLARNNLVFDYNIDKSDPRDVEEKKIIHGRNEAWVAMMNRALELAKASYGNQEEFDNLLDIYEISINKLNAAKREAQSVVKLFKEQVSIFEEERYRKEKIGFFKRVTVTKEELAEKERKKDEELENKIVSLIWSFDVPNTQEDVYEFMVFAVSNINYDVLLGKDRIHSTEERQKIKRRNDAWIEKVKRIYRNSKPFLENNIEYRKIEDVYNQMISKIALAEEIQNKKSRRKKRIITLLIVIGGIIHTSIIIYAFIAADKEEKAKQAVRNSETIIVAESKETTDVKENHSSEKENSETAVDLYQQIIAKENLGFDKGWFYWNSYNLRSKTEVFLNPEDNICMEVHWRAKKGDKQFHLSSISFGKMVSVEDGWNCIFDEYSLPYIYKVEGSEMNIYYLNEDMGELILLDSAKTMPEESFSNCISEVKKRLNKANEENELGRYFRYLEYSN